MVDLVGSRGWGYCKVKEGDTRKPRGLAACPAKVVMCAVVGFGAEGIISAATG